MWRFLLSEHELTPPEDVAQVEVPRPTCNPEAAEREGTLERAHKAHEPPNEWFPQLTEEG
eukprot:scaffold221630_cov30-Tisochrysis_lutea.AAC.8